MQRALWWCVAIGLLLPGGAGAGELPRSFAYLRDVAPDILQDMRYAGADNFTGRPVPGYEAGECVLQRTVAELLKKVQAELRQQGLGLKVYDCYRPGRATAAFLQWMSGTSRPLQARHHPRVDRRRLRALGYISPSSAHSRGAAVDLTLVRDPPAAQPSFNATASYGPCSAKVDQRSPDNSLDMGTGFDCFDALAHADAARLLPAQLQARTLLRSVMQKHGFSAYHREWWHFTYARAMAGPVLDFVIKPPVQPGDVVNPNRFE
jgi:D-alanyl-D-alanine dipeptidase